MDPESCRKGVTHTSQPPYITPMIPVQLELWTSPLPAQSTLILADIWSMKPYRDTNISLTNGPETGPLNDGVNELMKGRKTESMCGSIISRSRLPWYRSRISQKIKSSNASTRPCLIAMRYCLCLQSVFLYLQPLSLQPDDRLMFYHYSQMLMFHWSWVRQRPWILFDSGENLVYQKQNNPELYGDENRFAHFDSHS